MIKKITVTILFACTIIVSSCDSKEVSHNVPFNPYYAAPDEIISAIDKTDKNYYHNYILAKAYLEKKELKNSLLCFANSCFISRYNFSLRLFPQPVYAFLDSYSSKSPYFADSVYQIASIFYQYNEHEYVIKFTDLIKNDGSALYRDSVLLKSRSLQKLNRLSEAEKILKSLTDDYQDNASISEIYMKLGSVYESMGRFQDAAEAYIKIVKSMKEAWHDDVAVKRILYLISAKGIKISDSASRIAIAESLFNAKDFTAAETFLSGLVKSGGESDADLLNLKIQTRKKYAESVRILKQHEKKPVYEKFALAHANELWEAGNKYAAVQTYSKIAGTSDKEIASRILTRLAFYFEERSNPEFIKYMAMYVRMFPKESQSGRFIWLTGRYFLKTGNNQRASEYFTEAVKKYPEGPYTGNCRYWNYKIKHQANPATIEEKLKLMKELCMFNPESTHTLSLLSETASKKKTEDLEDMFDKAADAGDQGGMLLYHTLLFMKSGYDKSHNARFSKLDSSITGRYIKFNKDAAGSSFKSSAKKILTNLEKYFKTGDIESINRELSILDDADSEISEDISRTVSQLSSLYGHYNYSTFYGFRYIDSLNIPENLALLSPEFSRTLYPPVFMDCVLTESRKYNVKPSVVLAMMKAESNFNVTAVSPVGAEGLMQLMPLTARGIAKEIGLNTYNLKNPCTSVKFGANYISWLDRYFKGEIALMVAGYNAGPGNVDLWLKRYKDKDIDYISEFTPFPETRDYIFRTKKYMIQYESLYKAENE